MAFPRNIAGVLGKHPEITRPRILTSVHECQGARFHSPKPLEVHRVLIHQRSVFLCGICRDNLQLLVDLVGAESEPLAWIVLREFGSGIRQLLGKEPTDG